MKTEKQVIRIRLDYLQGPIWMSDIETGEPLTGIDIIDTDKIIIKLNGQISDLYLSYYEFDSHDMPCWFNAEQQKADKNKMLSLINQKGRGLLLVPCLCRQGYIIFCDDFFV